MRTLFLAITAVAAVTIGVSTASADHLRRPAPYCAPSYSAYRGVSVGYPAYSVHSYQSYRVSPAYTARQHVHQHHVHHLHAPARHYPSVHSVHHYGYSPYGSGVRVGVRTGSFGLHIGF